jgi:hypothetical protein
MLDNRRLSIKVLPAYKQALEQIAIAEGESVSAVVRRLIRSEAKRRGIWRVAAQAAGQAESRKVEMT